MTPQVASIQSQLPTLEFEPDTRTLVGEHVLLLHNVRRRAAPVLALTDTHTWPAAELQTLIAFLRGAVLRHVSAEERLLFPGDYTTKPLVELCSDHLHLRTLIEQLDQASSEPCALPGLVAIIDDLLTTLERHMIDEEAALAALPGAPQEMPGTAELATGSPTGSPPAARRPRPRPPRSSDRSTVNPGPRPVSDGRGGTIWL